MTYLLSQLKNGLSYKLSWSQNSQNLQFAYSFTSALSAAKCTVFLNKWAHFSSNKMVFQISTRTEWDNGGCKNVEYFLMMTLSLWKQGWYIATRVAPVTFWSGPSNNSSKRFSETLLCWASTSFCRYSFLQKPSFQIFKVFLES